jgi:hypothetical protein
MYRREVMMIPRPPDPFAIIVKSKWVSQIGEI